MDVLQLVQFIQRLIKDRKTQILEILENNQVKSMEQYQHLMGEIAALNHIAQELSGLLEQQERMHD